MLPILHSVRSCFAQRAGRRRCHGVGRTGEPLAGSYAYVMLPAARLAPGGRAVEASTSSGEPLVSVRRCRSTGSSRHEGRGVDGAGASGLHARVRACGGPDHDGGVVGDGRQPSPFGKQVADDARVDRSVPPLGLAEHHGGRARQADDVDLAGLSAGRSPAADHGVRQVATVDQPCGVLTRQVLEDGRHVRAPLGLQPGEYGAPLAAGDEPSVCVEQRELEREVRV